MAILVDKKEILKTFLKTKPNLNKPIFNSLLHQTVCGGKVEFTEMLIDYGLDVNSYFSDADGTPIHVAITYTRHNSIKITQMLLKKGASIKIRNREGNSPLESALKKKNSQKLDFIKVIAHHQHNNGNLQSYNCDFSFRTIKLEQIL